MLSEQLKTYLIDFLVGIEHDDEASMFGCPIEQQSLGRSNLIGYTRNPIEMIRYKLVIYPSSFFEFGTYGTDLAQPQLPLQEWRGIPLLFGQNKEEWINNGKTLVIYADIFASTYYLISRYEEMYRRKERDKHGRFSGKLSLPYRAGFIHRPVVDEYSEALRSILDKHDMLRCRGIALQERPRVFSKVNLSHDVDQPYEYRGLRSYIRAVWTERRNPIHALRLCFGSPKRDKFNTFAKFLEWNGLLAKHCPKGVVNTIFFLKTPTEHRLDKPNYRLSSGYMRPIVDAMKRANAKFGLHCSYASGIMPHLIGEEKKSLQTQLQVPIQISRHHFLAQREPEDMLSLYSVGIRHDYTMGYADVAGFRLGTCRPVKYINPNTRSLIDLMIHPLTMMDVSLSRADYMNLDKEQAQAYAEALVRQVARYNGELNLLWHNEQFSPEVHPWHSSLYRHLLKVIELIELDDPRGLAAQSLDLAERLKSCGGTAVHL